LVRVVQKRYDFILFKGREKQHSCLLLQHSSTTSKPKATSMTDRIAEFVVASKEGYQTSAGLVGTEKGRKVPGWVRPHVGVTNHLRFMSAADSLDTVPS